MSNTDNQTDYAAEVVSRSPTNVEYFVVMIDYGKKGREAVIDPETTRPNVIDMIRSREYQNIIFIHHVVVGEIVEDVTEELTAEAAQISDAVDGL